MGGQELIEHLRSEGEKKAAMVWKESEAEAEQIRNTTEMKIRQMREDFSRRLERTARRQQQEIISEAQHKSRQINLAAEKALSDRLFSLAAGFLPELRTEGYEEIFSSLVREVPPYEWAKVRVNPEDIRSARRHFPDAEIEPDDGISGGFEIISEDGKICVTNTFGKRLERLWEDVLPVMMKDIRSYIYGNKG